MKLKHVVIGGFLTLVVLGILCISLSFPYLYKKGACTSTNDDDNGNMGDTEQLDDTVDYDEEELVEAINESNNTDYKSSVEHVSRVVGCFRTVTKYIRKSTIVKVKLDSIQGTNSTNVLSLELDV